MVLVGWSPGKKCRRLQISPGKEMSQFRRAAFLLLQPDGGSKLCENLLQLHYVRKSDKGTLSTPLLLLCCLIVTYSFADTPVLLLS